MLAVDTNVVVRYLVNDDPSQSARARSLIDGEDVFVPLSVLLETEWVLRDVYGLSRGQVAKGLETLAGLPTVQVEDPLRLRQTLKWFADGLDFADALHLAGVAHCECFLTFDKAFVSAARTVSAIPVRQP